jgi:hypothetical protein
MTGKTSKKVENRKNWVAPELKKIDIELITASGRSPYTHSDGGATHS